MATGEQAARALEDIRESLERSQGLAEAYARAMLQKGIQNAASRPTPQAPMAANAMGVQGSSISLLTGGTPEEVSAGSEWGSDIYKQFGPRNESGWWLMPAGESAEVQSAGDRYLEQMMDSEVRGL
jgi:hypothetical protein